MIKTRNPFEVARAVLSVVALSVTVTDDQDFRWDGDGPDPSTYSPPLYPFDIAVTAKAIVGGEEVEGNAYLGGSYYEFGAKPAQVIADEVGGYLTQMVDEALMELKAELCAIVRESVRPPIGRDPAPGTEAALAEINKALAELKILSKEKYDEQMKDRIADGDEAGPCMPAAEADAID